jgi:putative heme iron utilization protein
MSEAEKTNGETARRFVRAHQSGVLSTISQRVEGFPFGSVAPFMLDQTGCPVILISTLAEHTKNIDADPRVSLIVQPYSPDMQIAGRVTLLGRARRLDNKSALGPRYLRFHPQAESYFAMHDFHFYRIEPVRVRFIGGFGKIHWVEPAQYLLPDTALTAQENDILDHMNADHADTLRAYCRQVHGLETPQTTMIGIDPDGFDVRAKTQILRFDFDVAVMDAQQARRALIELATAAKTATSR